MSSTFGGVKRPRENFQENVNARNVMGTSFAAAAAAPMGDAQQQSAAARIASLEAQLSCAAATIQQQEAEIARLRHHAASMEHHLRGTFGDSDL